MGEPGFQLAADIFHASGAEILRITPDGEGMKLKNLEQLIMNFPIKLIYLNPSFHNPTSITMSSKRRKDLIVLAKKYNVLIVEEDSTGLLYYQKKQNHLLNRYMIQVLSIFLLCQTMYTQISNWLLL